MPATNSRTVGYDRLVSSERGLTWQGATIGSLPGLPAKNISALERVTYDATLIATAIKLGVYVENTDVKEVNNGT